MTEFEFKISSKEDFIFNLRPMIDNEKYIFSLPKKRFSGYYNSELFELVENNTKLYRNSYYRIKGKIENDKVIINLKPSGNSYFLLIFYSILFVAFLMGWYFSEYSWTFAIFLSILIINSFIGIIGYMNRKERLYSEFEDITNNIKTVQNNGEHEEPL